MGTQAHISHVDIADKDQGPDISGTLPRVPWFLITSYQLFSLVLLMLTLLLSGCDGPASNASASTVMGPPNSQVVATPTDGPAGIGSSFDALATPVRLLIPAIGINSAIEDVGILDNGNLGIPTHDPWNDVGWYDMGPFPGERGSAVIDGHLDRPGGFPAVFWNLRNLHVGDKVMILNTRGKTLSFRVTRIEYYPPDAAPVQEIFGNQTGNYLNLITCAGDWIPNQHQTTLRLVVYTTLAG